MAISKKAKAKIDALKNGDEITKEQSSVSSEEVNADAIPLDLLNEDDAPIEVVSVGAVDTVLEETEVYAEDIDLSKLDCPQMSEGNFRMYSFLLPESLSLKSYKETVDLLVCSDDRKTIIRRFLNEDIFDYCYLLFRGKKHSDDPIKDFIVIGQKSYYGLPFVIDSNVQNINETEELLVLRESLKYDLLERINNLTFMSKNIGVVLNQYISGADNDFSELRLNYHKEVKPYKKE